MNHRSNLKPLGSWQMSISDPEISVIKKKRKGIIMKEYLMCCLEKLTCLFKSCEDGLSAGVLRICELHHTIVVCLIQTKHSTGVLGFEGLYSDDFILAQALAGLVVCEPS